LSICTKSHHFEIKNAKNFWGGDTPSPDPNPLGAIAVAPTVPRSSRLGRSSVTTPEKNPIYGLGLCYTIDLNIAIELRILITVCIEMCISSVN